ncbi:MAG: uvrD [Chlamydiales bacterium]|jgi:superfamily I DNA/RNA helicase|nr:uvrD [Chlamydiales bacterium]
MSFTSIFSRLNPPQQKAVTSTDGRVLILAGAGSGKTRVLTIRIAHLIQNLGASPDSILGLTFTNKAAAEMRHRVAEMLGSKIAKKITLCTFHSLCMQILRKDIHHLGYTSEFSLYDEKDIQRLVALIARDILQHEGVLPSLKPTLLALAEVNNRDFEWKEEEQTENETPDIWHTQFAKEIQKRLEDSLRAYNAVDFDHLLKLTVQLFEQFPAVLEKYQKQYQYIMIDEYQDTNPIQYRLAELLAQSHDRLCVVGDDDQSIYGWRGADIKNILSFDRAILIKLEQNYRSTNIILSAANTVIKNNKERHDKRMWSTQTAGPLIEVFHAPNEENEAEAVIHRIALLKEKENLKWSDFAILYRSNLLSRPFETALLKYTWKDGDEWCKGIPYQVFGGQEFYERREIKDLTAYMRVIVNPKDQEALLRIINIPRRHIGESTLDHLTQINRKEQVPLWDVLCEAARDNYFHIGNFELGEIPKKAKSGIISLVHIIEEAKSRFEQGPLHQGLAWLVDAIKYQKVIEEEVKSQKMRDFKWENVQEFIQSLEQYQIEKTTEGFATQAHLSDFISSLALDMRSMDSKKSNIEQDSVSLMTFHSSKGLEFEACFMIALEDHIMPHSKSIAIEEERRLMYVGITRAKKHLCCSMARKRKYMGKELQTTPSRFLLEIPKENLRPTVWDNP